MQGKTCPECNGNIFHHDIIRDETCCRQCGLVLNGPVTHGIIYPQYKIIPSKKTLLIKSRISHNLFVKYTLS